MNNKIMMLCAAVVLAVTVGACTNAPKTLPPGKYETSSKSVDSQGTAYESKKTTNVEVDQYGNKKATVETESTKDPEGLFNKSKTETKSTY